MVTTKHISTVGLGGGGGGGGVGGEEESVSWTFVLDHACEIERGRGLFPERRVHKSDGNALRKLKINNFQFILFQEDERR